MSTLRVGLALTGSYCTYAEAFTAFETLCEKYDVTAIMSENASSADSRFGASADFIERLETLTGKKVITTIVAAEPIGPKKLLDIVVIAPCTGNTLAKLTNGITDTCVTMAAKAHLRNCRPVLLGISTNDGLAGSAKNIGTLLTRKNIYFVPFYQDDPVGKPTSLATRYDLLDAAIDAACEGRQLQPILA